MLIIEVVKRCPHDGAFVDHPGGLLDGTARSPQASNSLIRLCIDIVARSVADGVSEHEGGLRQTCSGPSGGVNIPRKFKTPVWPRR